MVGRVYRLNNGGEGTYRLNNGGEGTYRLNNVSKLLKVWCIV